MPLPPFPLLPGPFTIPHIFPPFHTPFPPRMAHPPTPLSFCPQVRTAVEVIMPIAFIMIMVGVRQSTQKKDRMEVRRKFKIYN